MSAGKVQTLWHGFCREVLTGTGNISGNDNDNDNLNVNGDGHESARSQALLLHFLQDAYDV